MDSATLRKPSAPQHRGEVIKHSAAIQITNTITLLQRRTFNVLLAYAYDMLLMADTHRMRVADLRERLSLSTHNDGHLKSMLRGLAETNVEWNVLEKDGKEEWGVGALIADVAIKDGEIEYSFGGIMRRRLFNPRMYARISLSIQNRFGSKHALALYELLIDYLGVGKTRWMDLDEFRHLMGLEPDQYASFKDLNRYVIKKAVREVDNRSDLRARVEYRRSRRVTTAVKFFVEAKDRNALREKVGKVHNSGDARDKPVREAFEHWFDALSEKEKDTMRQDALTRFDDFTRSLYEDDPNGLAASGTMRVTLMNIWQERVAPELAFEDVETNDT